VAYDVAAVRADFPALGSGTAFFDGPGGTQTPRQVIDATAVASSGPLSNRGRHTSGERNAELIVAEARSAVADLVGARRDGVVFGRSATQLTFDLARAMSASWGPGDEVVVTRLDHDANVTPWVLTAEGVGATVRRADFDPERAELDPDHVAAVLSERTRLVALTAASNLVGTRPDVSAIAALAHESGAMVHVDAVHACAHTLVDMDALGADSLTCSPYKFLGPHLGVLAARIELLEALRPDKLRAATDAIPERFELGTLPYELLAGTTAAVEVLAGLDRDATGSRRDRLRTSFGSLADHEDSLRGTIEAALGDMPGVTVHSRARHRTPTLLMTIAGRDTAEAHRFLAERGVAAPSGSFYAIEPSRRLGLGDAGGLRVGLAPYNDSDDVDRLVDGLEAFIG
jgi:cysteine desulfurase family protein (TIGR01976 family)